MCINKLLTRILQSKAISRIYEKGPSKVLCVCVLSTSSSTHTHRCILYNNNNNRIKEPSTSVHYVRTHNVHNIRTAYDVRKYAMRVPRGFDLDAAIAHHPKRVHQPE